MLKKTLRLKLGLLDKKKKKNDDLLVRPAIGLEVESGNPGADYSTNDLRSCHETGRDIHIHITFQSRQCVAGIIERLKSTVGLQMIQRLEFIKVGFNPCLSLLIFTIFF